MQELRTAAGRLSITRSGPFSSCTHAVLISRTDPGPIAHGVADESMADFQKKGLIFAQVSVASWKEQVDKNICASFARHTGNLGLN